MIHLLVAVLRFLLPFPPLFFPLSFRSPPLDRTSSGDIRNLLGRGKGVRVERENDSK